MRTWPLRCARVRTAVVATPGTYDPDPARPGERGRLFRAL